MEFICTKFWTCFPSSKCNDLIIFIPLKSVYSSTRTGVVDPPRCELHILSEKRFRSRRVLWVPDVMQTTLVEHPSYRCGTSKSSEMSKSMWIYCMSWPYSEVNRPPMIKLIIKKQVGLLTLLTNMKVYVSCLEPIRFPPAGCIMRAPPSDKSRK